MNRLGVVTGILSEADCLEAGLGPLNETDRPMLYCAGANAERARRGALALAAQGACCLVSFGIAGGLDPSLHPGDLVLPHWVVADNGARHATATPWRDAIAAEVGDACRVVSGSLYGSPHVVGTVAEKATLHARLGCIAVDMESHAVADAAAEAGVPFLAVRVIADHATRAFPHALQGSLTAEGRQRALLVISRLLLRAWETPAVIGLGRDYRAAMRTLGSVAVPALRRVAARGLRG